MTLGLEAIKFLLEQDEANVPIVQAWIDKWFWRGYRVTGLVAQMLDYMLPRKVMSWKEAFELYFEQQMMQGLFQDLAFYGIRPPKHVEDAIGEKEILSHQVYWILYQFSHAAAFTTSVPDDEHLEWLSKTYPDTFDTYYKPLWDKEKRNIEAGGRHFVRGLPQLCQVCQIPMGFTEPGDPTTICQRAGVQRREVPDVLERLPVDLRARAGEVRPGLAARPPDLPGQLRGPHCPTSSSGTACRTGTTASTRLRRRAQLEEVARRDRRQRAQSAPAPRPERRPTWQSTASARTTSLEVPPGALRRRPARARGSRTTHGSVRRRASAPKAMTWGDFWSQLVIPFAEEDPDFDPPPRAPGPCTARPSRRGTTRPSRSSASSTRTSSRPSAASHPTKVPYAAEPAQRHTAPSELPETQRNRCGDVHDHRRATRS